MIHVCDDNRRMNRDFYCSRELLLTHMTYFSPYLADVSASLIYRSLLPVNLLVVFLAVAHVALCRKDEKEAT